MEPQNSNTTDKPRRNKLGLALAGGGFRASLFHLGVLRRMAQLDLLRYVELISTVSGGSIIGALYILLLKEKIDKSGTLSRQQYVELIDELDRILIRGIQKNLRTRLFMNPLAILRVLFTGDTLARRMARIYERYLYREVADRLQPKSWRQRLFRPGKIFLRNLLMKPKSPTLAGGLEFYNRKAVEEKRSVITSLVLNATTLNSGVPFRFSSVEVGDSRLGFFRYDEIDELLKRKRLLFSISMKELGAYVKTATSRGQAAIEEIKYDRATVFLAYWWRAIKNNTTEAIPQPPEEWKVLLSLDLFPGRIQDTEFGLLRQVKLAAWYLRKGTARTPPVDGGLNPQEHKDLFWDGFGKIYEEQAKALRETIEKNNLFDKLLDFVLELYYIRTADIVKTTIKKDWESLTLGEAVGASACFPPVFPPFIVLGFYDDAHVTRLGLTDGGVYDNVGITTLIDERCNYIIASDTGGLFKPIEKSTTGRIGMMGRIVSILMDDVAHNQRENLRERRDAVLRIEELCRKTSPPLDGLKSDDLLGLSFFHINSPKIKDGKGVKQDLDSKLIASLRTDLDGFGDVEIAALVNHGYDTADRYLLKYLSQSPYVNPEYWDEPAEIPKPLKREPEDVKRILQAGAARFFRAITLRAPVTITFSIAAVFAVLWLTWTTPVSAHGLIDWLAKLSLGWIQSAAFFLGEKWTEYKISLGKVILAVFAAAGLWIVLVRKVIDCFKKGFPRCYSRLWTVLKWAKSLWQNIVWVAGTWPLVVAFVGALLACVSHIFFYLPFRSKTGNMSDGSSAGRPKK